MTPCDVAIVGAGPAGLSAALVLGRCRRRVVLFDDDRPRNARATAVHGFLTREGISPAELRAIGRRELAPYDVTMVRETVVDAESGGRGFIVTTRGRARFSARKLLLATGIRDGVPEIAGIDSFYGSTVLQCAYCDGWEYRDEPIGACAPGEAGEELALGLTTWSRDVTLFTNGTAISNEALRARLARHGITTREARIARLEGVDRELRQVWLEGGERVACKALFLHFGRYQCAPLAEKLGCDLGEDEIVDTCERQKTAVPGLYVAGDASRGVKLAVIAAADGARAAHAINAELREEDTR